jgi:uncharacterized protein YecE (DUF72 family)
VNAPVENVRFGIAGWSYPDWEGYVYPPGTRDTLAFIARYVDMIEVNSTFYRPPDRKTVESWLRRTSGRPDFFFTAKLHQNITHGGRLEAATVDAFHAGLAPMVEAGKLRHLLAQFKWDFADDGATRSHLRSIRNAFGGLSNLTLELRHHSWQVPGALEFLGGLGVTVAHLDYPTARNSFNLRLCPVGQHAYFRLHGRNREAWFDRTAGRDQTYNYCYPAGELREITERAIEIARMSRSLTLVANNHYQGKEAVNILQIKSMMTGRPVDAPALLAHRYPQLASVMSPPATRDGPCAVPAV